jgi:NADH-quinone oxidoreductase subunit C
MSQANSEFNNDNLAFLLQTKLGDKVLHSEVNFGDLCIEVSKENIHAVISDLKNDSVLMMNFLTLIGATHYPESHDREFCVAYHLHALTHNVRLRIKVFLPLSNPSITSITDIFIGANWQERETYDFFGIIFEGHPNLTRILNEDEMDYFPMRKEYHLEDGTREDKDDRYFGR